MKNPTIGSSVAALKVKALEIVVTEACGSCFFYRRPREVPASSGLTPTGWCRRFPAAEQKTPEEWCGEYKGNG